MNDAKIRIKMAALIREQLIQSQHESMSQTSFRLSEFCRRIQRIVRDAYLFESSIQRNWIMAAQKIQTRSRQNVNDLSYELQTLKSYLDQETKTLPSLSDLMAELMQLEDEYGRLQYNWQDKTLSVTSDSIVLDDTALGSFEIKLYLERLGQLAKDSPYRIIALDPNPAGSDSGITHPHVSHERLCEGDGFHLIRKALEQGRLCDFFGLVMGILNTYNPDSPYVALSDWGGYSCYDCGYAMNHDDSYCCEQCGNDFCSQCSTCCQICEKTICLGCSCECPSCRKSVCRECMTVCPECQESFCTDCMDGKEICNSCQQESEEYENEDEQADSTAA